MPNLFTAQSHYTQDAFKLEDEVRDILFAPFTRWRKNGYSPREIASVIHGMVWETEMQTIIDGDQEGAPNPKDQWKKNPL